MFINYKRVNKLCYFPYNEVESPKRVVKKKSYAATKKEGIKITFL
jgi:hypothetical protein